MNKLFFTTLTLLSVGFFSIGCQRLEKEIPQIPPPTFDKSVHFFSNCKEMAQKYQDSQNLISSIYEKLNEATTVFTPISTTATGSASNQTIGTNVQETNVDESDFSKIAPDHLIVSDGAKIHILDRQSLQEIDTITDIYSAQLYVNDTNLIVIGSKIVATPPNSASATPSFLPTQPQTLVRVYSLNKGQKLTLKSENSYEGRLSASRLNNGYLILVFQNYIYGISTANTDLSATQKFNGIDCTTILDRPVVDFDNSLTHVVVKNLSILSEPESSMGFWGTGDSIYVSSESILLIKSGIWWFNSYSTNPESLNSTIVTKLNYKGSKLSYRGVIEVPGFINNEWSIKDYPNEKVFAVATTSREFDGTNWNNWTSKNYLWIVEELENNSELNLKSSITNFAQNEAIQSVRYIDRIAYVVTFRQTDPLFAIDLRDFSQPKIVSELKAPGYSVYLHPVSQNTLVGIGYNVVDGRNSGLLVSLFNISNPFDLQQLNRNILFEGNPDPRLNLSYNHHDFFFDPDSKLLSFSFNKYDCSYGYTYCQNGSGRAIYSAEETLKFKGILTHSDMLPSIVNSWSDLCEIQRVFKFDNLFVTISQIGVRYHSISDITKIEKEIIFK